MGRNFQGDSSSPLPSVALLWWFGEGFSDAPFDEAGDLLASYVDKQDIIEISVNTVRRHQHDDST